MKVLITGSRFWQDWAVIYRVLVPVCGPGDTLIHGGARGADRISGHIGRALGCNVLAYPARWEQLGPSAGPVRNRLMVKLHPDIERAFAFPLLGSIGTWDMVDVLKAKKIPVTVL